MFAAGVYFSFDVPMFAVIFGNSTTKNSLLEWVICFFENIFFVLSKQQVLIFRSSMFFYFKLSPKSSTHWFCMAFLTPVR